MTDEIALFIDFENIRYSLINVQRREPDPQELIGVARRFGTVMVARAYADWTRQPEFFKGSLTAAMIDRVDCPAKVRERFRQNQAPMYPPQNGYDRGPDRDAPELGDETYTGAREDALDEANGHAEGQDVLNGAPEQDLEQHLGASAYDDNTDTLGDDEQGEADEGEERGEDNEDYNRRSAPYGYNGPAYYQQPPQQSSVITQSTVDLNMLMDIIEAVFDRPSVNTFVLMSGDRDFTRICARLKLRMNKRVIVVGIPGTVSRDLISAADQFIPLGYPSGQLMSGGFVPPYQSQSQQRPPNTGPFAQGPVSPDEPGFIQFLDYIDRHWSWRTIGGVANFIGDPFNPKNRFRGRLTRESARDLLRLCIDEHILDVAMDQMGNENLRLNREHPVVAPVLALNDQH
ncbi:MAG TPA: NYN domain-containing protein [Ktedonobacterales bacterium]|nr:NYN domain-containing protein [Ktedonobacterales bacterium]